MDLYTLAVISQQPVREEVGEGIIDFSTRWLLNQLIVYLQQHIHVVQVFT